MTAQNSPQSDDRIDKLITVLGLTFPEPVPILAAWRPNNENGVNIAIEALLAGDLKVTDVLLGSETFGGGSSFISTKMRVDGSSHRSNCLRNYGFGRTTCTIIAKRPSNYSFNGLSRHWFEEVPGENQ